MLKNSLYSWKARIGTPLTAFTGWCLVAAGFMSPLMAADNPPPEPAAVARVEIKHSRPPLSAADGPVSAHSPFEMSKDDCTLCHKNADPKNPGPIIKPVNEMCLECHEAFKEVLARKYKHAPAENKCTSCHDPHNSKQTKLLVEEASALCLGCHEPIRKLATESKVVHGALSMGAKCVNCHNPHGAAVEHLLNQLPFDLCVKCHSTNDRKDHEGKNLTNMKQLLDENPEWHGPVSAKDCTACHNPHGGNLFRMLKLAYPTKFYAPYTKDTYALCFDCHDEKLADNPQTTTQTSFRDGDRNLHYVHVNKAERGRTCRACHEVHASKQPHQIRDGVPYGSQDWILKINFKPTPTGGTCAKTCHAEKSYNNTKEADAK